MTRFSDNILSGFEAATSAASSRSPVVLCKTYNFAAVGGTTPITQTGTLPPNVQNLTAGLFITQQASATTSNKITVSAGGNNLLTIDQFGSASGYANQTTTGVARFTLVASACAAPPVPATNQTNGGEIPFAITFLPVSADKTGTYQIVLTYNRMDRAFPAPGSA